MQNFLLERDVYAFVGVFRGDGLVIEGKEERVYEEHPTEPFRAQVTRHGHTIRDGGLDATLVEDVVPITDASRFLSRAGSFLQPAHVLLGQVRVRVVEQGLHRRYQLRVRLTLAE